MCILKVFFVACLTCALQEGQILFYLLETSGFCRQPWLAGQCGDRGAILCYMNHLQFKCALYCCKTWFRNVNRVHDNLSHGYKFCRLGQTGDVQAYTWSDRSSASFLNIKELDCILQFCHTYELSNIVNDSCFNVVYPIFSWHRSQWSLPLLQSVLWSSYYKSHVMNHYIVYKLHPCRSQVPWNWHRHRFCVLQIVDLSWCLLHEYWIAFECFFSAGQHSPRLHALSIYCYGRVAVCGPTIFSFQ